MLPSSKILTIAERRRLAELEEKKRERAERRITLAKNRRSRPEIQNSTKLLIPKLPFERLVREIAQDIKKDVSIQKKAVEAIQEAAEQFLVKLLKFANAKASLGDRTTIKPEDIQYANANFGSSFLCYLIEES